MVGCVPVCCRIGVRGRSPSPWPSPTEGRGELGLLLGGAGYCGGAFALDVGEDLLCLRRGYDAGALDALEHDAVESASELNVAFARRAAAGEDICLFHISCLRFCFEIAGLVGLGLFNQKAPILDRGLSWECVSYIAPFSTTPVVRRLVARFG